MAERDGCCSQKSARSELEVYNDVNSDLVNLYRIIKYHPEELQKELRYILMSREIFFDAVEQCEVRGMTDIQRAARFFITIKESYGNTLKKLWMRSQRHERHGGVPGRSQQETE